MVSLGETAPGGTTAEEVARHEYGHHIAMHRLNPPWAAIDWGPKQWASAADVCARVTRKEAFPGDQGANYARNPGEAWAEVYRLMDERKAGILTANWSIITPGFYPADTALSAAERDVLQPWSAGKSTLFTRVFRKTTKKVWWIPLPTPLDGDLRISATLPNRANHEVALVDRPPQGDSASAVGRPAREEDDRLGLRPAHAVRSRDPGRRARSCAGLRGHAVTRLLALAATSALVAVAIAARG